MIRAKICGITSVEDARLAFAQGAWGIGMVFFPGSPRNISPEQAKIISESLPKDFPKIGVTVNFPPKQIRELVESTGINHLQFHGEETPDILASLADLPLKKIKAFRVNNNFDFRLLSAYQAADFFLVDALVKGSYGGTGQTVDFATARKIQEFGKPLLLAGGISAENLQLAISQVKPWAVDLSSSVEISPGKKSPEKMKNFFTVLKMHQQHF